MKKISMFVCLLFLAGIIQAQKFSKNQLYGCWKIVKLENVEERLKDEYINDILGSIVCFDSLRIYGKQVNRENQMTPGLYTIKDSTEIVSIKTEPGNLLSDDNTNNSLIISITENSMVLQAIGYNLYFERTTENCCKPEDPKSNN